MVNFALGSRSDTEEQAVALYASQMKLVCKRYPRYEDIPIDAIPVGTVEFMQKASGFNFGANTYPDFLSEFYGREIWETTEWPLGKRVFIKPSTKLKRFTGFVTDGSYRGKKKGPYFCSEVVQFIDEWRYYIDNGRVVGAYWYAGTDDDAPPPNISQLGINYPANWVGSIDLGMTIDRGLIVVEAHEPFSVGWYGTLTNYKIYAEWLISGWEYLKNKYSSGS